MYATDVMVEEHKNINYMLRVIREICCGILEGAPVDADEHRRIIDFVRNYADRYHHGKEEKFLFPVMESRLGVPGQSLIRHGMLVEHDLGRAHVADWENALKLYEKEPLTTHKLDILTGAMGYADLLQRHTEKENNVVYPYGEAHLPADDKAVIDGQAREFEGLPESEDVREKYLTFLKEMMEKYGVEYSR